MKIKKRDLFNAFAVLAIISIMVYMITRATLLFFAEYKLIERVLAIILLLCEFFVIIHGFGYVVNILRIMNSRLEDIPKIKPGLEEPSVAILVAARHEPKEVLENTFITLNNLAYKNKNVYFLDDSSLEEYKQEAQVLCQSYNLKLFRRQNRHGAKAGIINDCLKNLKEKYVAIFDADQNPLPNFLQVLIPILESNDNLGFVQSPQFYSNIEISRVARGSAFQQAVFYEYICEGKSSSDSMFCCGTNVVFRRKALIDVGGLDESTVTEDFATSLKLHTQGWKSLYYPHVYAFGMGPESLSGYFKQQFRWAIGTISVFKKVIFKFLTKPFSLSLSQWWEYFLSSSYYLIGVAFFIMMLCPIIYILFKIPSFFAKPEIYFLAFFPYILLSMSIFYLVLKGRNYRLKDLFLGQLLGEITSTVYMRAAVSAILGVKATFGITQKTKVKAIPYILLWPQISLILFSFIALVWGINRYIYEREIAILVNSFWTLYNGLIFISIFYFNKEEK